MAENHNKDKKWWVAFKWRDNAHANEGALLFWGLLVFWGLVVFGFTLLDTPSRVLTMILGLPLLMGLLFIFMGGLEKYKILPRKVVKVKIE